MTTKNSFISQHKEIIQVVYGTAVVVALYFGLSTKIELLSQKHDSDMNMINYRITQLESKKTSQETNSTVYENKYAVLPKKYILPETNFIDN